MLSDAQHVVEVDRCGGMGAERRLATRALVFRGPPWVPVPSRTVLTQAIRGAAAEGLVQAALHPLDGLVLRETLRAGPTTTPIHVRLFCLRSAIHAATGAALGATAFALAYAALSQHLQTNQRPERALIAAAAASILSIAVDAPLRIAGAAHRMGTKTQLRHALAASSRDVPADALEFATYELFRGTSTNPLLRACAGAVSGAISTFAVAPMDAALAVMLANRQHAFAASLAHVWRTRAAFAGVGGRCLRESLASALFFCVYDVVDDDTLLLRE